MPPQSDYQVWDQETFIRRWRKVYPALRRFLGSWGIAGPDADDAVQAVALRLVQANLVGKDDAHFEALAVNAAKWVGVDMLRAGNVVSRRMLESADSAPEPMHDDDPMRHAHLREAVASALASMTSYEIEILKAELLGERDPALAARLVRTELAIRVARASARKKLIDAISGLE